MTYPRMLKNQVVDTSPMVVGRRKEHPSSMMVTGLDSQGTGRDGLDAVRDITLLDLQVLISGVGDRSQTVKPQRIHKRVASAG